MTNEKLPFKRDNSPQGGVKRGKFDEIAHTIFRYSKKLDEMNREEVTGFLKNEIKQLKEGSAAKTS